MAVIGMLWSFLCVGLLAFCQVEATTSPPASPTWSPSRGVPKSPSRSGSFRWQTFNSLRLSRAASLFGSKRSDSTGGSGTASPGSTSPPRASSLKRSDSFNLFENVADSDRRLRAIQSSLIDNFALDPTGETVTKDLAEYRQIGFASPQVESVKDFLNKFREFSNREVGTVNPDHWGWKHFCFSSCLNQWGYILVYTSTNPSHENPKVFKMNLISLTEPYVLSSNGRFGRVKGLFSKPGPNQFTCACNTAKAFSAFLKQYKIDERKYQEYKKSSRNNALTYINCAIAGRNELKMVPFEGLKDYIIDALESSLEPVSFVTSKPPFHRHLEEGRCTQDQRWASLVQAFI